MPTTYRATLTEVGAALVADAIASGTTLTWAKMALGDGNGSAVTVDPSRTSLVNEQYRAPLNDLGRDSANPNTIVGTLVVPPETGGWTIREFGIYDNAATPRLVAYGETPEIEKPASSAGTGINLRLRFKLIVSAEANITLAPDSNEAYATIEYVKDNAVKSLSVSGRTITYTMGDGDTHTITTQDTTYSDATQSVHGLMSTEDKIKIDDVVLLSTEQTLTESKTINKQYGAWWGKNPNSNTKIGLYTVNNDKGLLINHEDYNKSKWLLKSSQNGNFYLSAHDVFSNDNTKELIGSYHGELTWDNNPVIVGRCRYTSGTLNQNYQTMKWSNGFMMITGYFKPEILDSNGLFVITYPEAFLTMPYISIVGMNMNVIYRVNGADKTQARFNATGVNGTTLSPGVGVVVFLILIGRWKA